MRAGGGERLCVRGEGGEGLSDMHFLQILTFGVMEYVGGKQTGFVHVRVLV